MNHLLGGTYSYESFTRRDIAMNHLLGGTYSYESFTRKDI